MSKKETMKYIIYKDFRDSLANLYQKGGLYQNNADEVYSLVGKIEHGQDSDPFHGMQHTKSGEGRIKHCIKYDLGRGCRLITIRDKGVHALCYVGNHDDCDHWIEKKKGLQLAVNDRNELVELRSSENITEKDKRIYTEEGKSTELLHKKISGRFLDKISEGVPASILMKFSELKATGKEEDIMNLCCEIDDKEKQNVFFDVFCKLREGDVEGATKSIELYIRQIMTLKDMSDDKLTNIKPGNDFIDIDDLPPELLEHFVKTAEFKKWMLFMHPDQRKFVERNFKGPAKLVGVSGSGKTAIIVKRAVYLVQNYPEEKILILTLNKSLANLIENLIKYVCLNENEKDRIHVYSFWMFCKEKLKDFEPQNNKLYNDLTWKTNEHIDEIWNEYFECKLHNDDAKVLNPLNRSLLARKVYPKDYIRQEFDWLRTALPPSARSKYLEIERFGRTEPLTKEFRNKILDGLKAWEEKMGFVGAIDYLGLSTALYKYIDKIEPCYRCLLVDEVQDFGTIELEIIKRLVPEKENNIFLCGDVAQQVYCKQHRLLDAGINITGRSYTIKKNYRNSKEILMAAYDILKRNIDFKNLENEDFVILEPEYANISSPKPLLLKAETLEEEFAFSLNYLQNTLKQGQKACIAICGYSIVDVKEIGRQLNIPVLDGETDISNNNIFLSDLEQTKGFEFDTVCIINCNLGVIPNPNLPEGESYREVSKFYVAMTRAKWSLILSHSRNLSEIIQMSKQYFNEFDWQEHEEKNSINDFEMPLPMVTKNEMNIAILDMTGQQFVYTRHAVGISQELYDKLIEKIDGRGASLDRRKVRWSTIGEALRERDIPAIAQQFGAQKTYGDFLNLFKEYDINKG